MTDVLVAIPAIAWQINAALAAFLCQLTGRANDPTTQFHFHLAVAPEISPVQYARNILVGDFLRHKDMDLLWFIDHDMVPEPNVLDLLEVDADIVSGRCLASLQGKRGLELVVTAFSGRNVDTGGFERVAPDVQERVPIVGAGAANLLIRRRVLEDPRMHLPAEYDDLAGKRRSIKDDADAPAVFRTLYKPNGNVLLSEDIDFVHRASQLGYRCVYEPFSRMGHLKTADLNGIEQMLEQSRRSESARRSGDG